MNESWFDEIYLEDAQRDLLAWMVEQERSRPREERGPFFVLGMEDGYFLIYPGLGEGPAVQQGDLETLADRGLVRRGFGSKGMPSYDITPEGRRYYAEMKRRLGEAVETVETEIRTYLDAEGFRAAFSDAYARWREAADALWDADSESEFTRIGHLCREAMQAFAANLAERHGITGMPADPAKTVDRIRAVLNKVDLGEKHKAFLDALLPYWGTVSDLVQRQEHGAKKKGDPLTWEDARRVVFQTAIVIFEVARAVS